MLGHERQPGAHEAGRLVPGDVDAVEQDPPGRRAEQPGDRAEQRRLAGAVGSDEGDELARADVERDAVERDDGAVARRQPLDDGSIRTGCTTGGRPR